MRQDRVGGWVSISSCEAAPPVFRPIQTVRSDRVDALGVRVGAGPTGDDAHGASLDLRPCHAASAFKAAPLPFLAASRIDAPANVQLTATRAKPYYLVLGS